MMMIEDDLSKWMRTAFSAAMEGAGGDVGDVTVVASTTEEFGEFQCNHAMALVVMAMYLSVLPNAVRPMTMPLSSTSSLCSDFSASWQSVQS